jgi:putative sterol carrier protein
VLDQSTNSFQVMTDLVELLNGDDQLLKLVNGWHRTVLFVIDGERYLIETGERQVELRRDIGAEARADLSFAMDRTTLLQIVREETAPITAKMTGRINSTGSLIEILKFVSVLSKTIREYNRRGGPKP